MENTEQPVSSHSTENDQNNNFLTEYMEQIDLLELPTNINEEMQQKNAAWVKITGSPRLNNIKNLNKKYLAKTLQMSLEQEVDPFENQQSQEYFNTLKDVATYHFSWSLNEFLEKTENFNNKELIRSLPSIMSEPAEQLLNALEYFLKITHDWSEHQYWHERTEFINLLNIINDTNTIFSELHTRWTAIKKVKENLTTQASILKISDNYAYQFPVYLQMLSHLVELHIDAYLGIKLPTGIENLINLKQLYINKAIFLPNLIGLSHNNSVTHLIIDQATNFLSLEGINSLPSLESISIFHASSPIDFIPLSTAKNLKFVTITHDAGNSYIDDGTIQQAVAANNEHLVKMNAERTIRGLIEVRVHCSLDPRMFNRSHLIMEEGIDPARARANVMLWQEPIQTTSSDATSTTLPESSHGRSNVITTRSEVSTEHFADEAELPFHGSSLPMQNICSFLEENSGGECPRRDGSTSEEALYLLNSPRFPRDG